MPTSRSDAKLDRLVAAWMFEWSMWSMRYSREIQRWQVIRTEAYAIQDANVVHRRCKLQLDALAWLKTLRGRACAAAVLRADMKNRRTRKRQGEAMIFRVWYKVLGGHTHCMLFAASRADTTFAKCGEFTVRNSEFDQLRIAMRGVEFCLRPSVPPC